MSNPVPNSDDPALSEGIEERRTLKGWNLLVYKCKQQPLVPIGIPPLNNPIPSTTPLRVHH